MPTDFFERDLGTETPQASQEEHQADRLARQRESVNRQVSGASSEIEFLRGRQEALEKERAALQDLKQKQEQYEDGKREMLESLSKTIVVVEKEEAQATRMAALLAETRERFGEMLGQLRQVDEESWVDETFETELNGALSMVNLIRDEYRKAMARIDASSWHKTKAGKSEMTVLAASQAETGQRSFLDWMLVGLAVSLPATGVLIVLFLIQLYLSGHLGL